MRNYSVARTPMREFAVSVRREELASTGSTPAPLSVLMGEEPVLSCLVLGMEAEDVDIVTIEGMMQGNQPHPLQKAFTELGATQCGYCIPGFLLTAKALLDNNPHPSRDEIKEALSGNLCRCTGYTKILEAVELAARNQEVA